MLISKEKFTNGPSFAHFLQKNECYQHFEHQCICREGHTTIPDINHNIGGPVSWNVVVLWRTQIVFFFFLNLLSPISALSPHDDRCSGSRLDTHERPWSCLLLACLHIPASPTTRSRCLNTRLLFAQLLMMEVTFDVPRHGPIIRGGGFQNHRQSSIMNRRHRYFFDVTDPTQHIKFWDSAQIPSVPGNISRKSHLPGKTCFYLHSWRKIFCSCEYSSHTIDCTD